jgi:hypothetical protein
MIGCHEGFVKAIPSSGLTTGWAVRRERAGWSEEIAREEDLNADCLLMCAIDDNIIQEDPNADCLLMY